MDLKVPVNLAITNTTNEVISFRYFKVNMVQEIQPSQTIKITVKNSDNLGYYESLKESIPGLSVETVLGVKSISIKTPPTKTNYDADEVFDPTGMVVEATYENDDTAEVTDYTYEPTRPLTGDDDFITITYGGKTAKQAIIVSEPAPGPDDEG